MHALSDAGLLSLWDQGRHCDQVDRALLLVTASGEPGRREPADLCIGERDLAIARLRIATLGRHLRGCARCGNCGELLEFEIDIERLVNDLAPPKALQFDMDGLRFRLPTSRDLAFASGARDASEAGRRILQQCCVESPDDIDWTDDQVLKAGASIGLHDQAADIRLGLDCASCAAQWSERLDMAAFFWDEIDQRARRLLDEVHCLAIAYGWSEAEILALGDARRAAYLERCNA